MLKPLNRLRPTLRASALVLGTLLALGLPLGCGDDTEPEEPIEEEVEPLTLTRGTRALVVGEQDIEIVRASVSLETEQIPALFPRVVLQRQLYDELPYQGTEEELRFGARVPELWTAIQADYGAFEQVVVALDVLTADGSAVVGPPSFKENARTFTATLSEMLTSTEFFVMPTPCSACFGVGRNTSSTRGSWPSARKPDQLKPTRSPALNSP